VARLIRSKGIGVFFITQTPKDVDEDVLAQLGNRVQHAIRAFTPKDAKNVKATASTFPESEHVDVQKSLTSLGIGEALVTVLDPKGVPTAVAATQVLAPCSFMSSIDDAQYQRVISASPLAAKYGTPMNRESAHEMLQKRLEQNAVEEPEESALSYESEDDFAWRKGGRPAARRRTSSPRPRKTVVEKAVNRAVNSAAREVGRSVGRGLLGLFKNW
jgi:uncharacterized protein